MDPDTLNYGGSRSYFGGEWRGVGDVSYDEVNITVG